MKITTIFLSAIILDLSSANDTDEPDGNKSNKESSSFEETNKQLTLRFHPKHKYLSAWNSSSEKVALLDYTQNISIIYDGKIGDVFGFLYEKYKAIYIPSNVSNKTWHIDRQSYEEYFNNPIPPTDLILIGEAIGYQFDSLTISPAFAKRIAKIMTRFSPDFNDQCHSFATRMKIAKLISDQFNTNLADFDKVIQPYSTKSRGDLHWTAGLADGLGYFFQLFGGIKALQDKQIVLSFERINNEKNCFQLLNYLLNELAPKFNLGEILKQSFNSPSQFFLVLSGLGGYVSYGFDGFIFMIYKILGLFDASYSRVDLLENLEMYLFNARAENNNLKMIFFSEIKTFMKNCKRLKLDDDFRELMVMLDQILKEKWIHNEVNMSRILKAIMEVEFPATENDFNKIVEVLDEEFQFEKKDDF